MMEKFDGITSDSRKVKKGYMFVAIKGMHTDGHDHIYEAVKNGAVVVVGEKDFKPPKGVKYIKVKDSRDALGKYASDFYGNPSQKLKVIGVTGTKGKTTTVYLIYHILKSLGKKVGMVSSIAAKIGDKDIDTGFHVTSPDVVSLHKFLKEMLIKGCEYAVIEVSSHGIDQKRIAGVDFKVGVLTNIAPEHLDYHRSFNEYKKVKMSFMNSCENKIFTPPETQIELLNGIFNNLNAEDAVQAVSVLGIKRDAAIKSLSTFNLPAGRLEAIKNKRGINIIVDFAHTPDSLEVALKYLKTQTKGKLISVFGCAGERDKSKRFKMGKISVSLADISIFTAEDPRHENIYEILNSVVRGAKAVKAIEKINYYKVPERGEAIAFALSLAKKGDTVAFFGKGHEKSMAYKDYEHPWSDQLAIKNFLEKNVSVAAILLAAGKGSRMHSEIPKVLHEICGRPLISYSLQNLRNSKIQEIIAVLSFKRNLIHRRINGLVKVAYQKNPKGGTADACAAGVKLVSKNIKDVMVLYSDDTAFYTQKTITEVLNIHKQNKSTLTFITLVKDDPHGLGRILRNRKGNVTGIVEEKDASDKERKIKEINDGLYIFDKKWLVRNLANVTKSPVTGELYIVELIKMAIDQNKKVIAHKLVDSSEWQGINTPEELDNARLKMEQKLISNE